MKKGAGLAVLAIAALYQANKMKNKRKALVVSTQIGDSKPVKRKSPIQVIKEAEQKLKREVNDILKEKEETVDNEPIVIADVQELEVVNKEVDTGVIEKSNPSEVVYVVGNGKKYHLTKECRGVKKNAEITEMTLTDAIDKEYFLCGWER